MLTSSLEQLPPYLFSDDTRSPQHIVVPEPDYAIAPSCQPTRALRVRLGLRVVLTAVDLYDKPCAQTYEVHDVRPYRMLPTERRALAALLAQHAPQSALRVGHVAPQPTR